MSHVWTVWVHMLLSLLVCIASSLRCRLIKSSKYALYQVMEDRLVDIEDLTRHYRRDSTSVVPYSFAEKEILHIRHQLLSWYENERRRLPWRGDAMPGYDETPPTSGYGTWVSEIMLQQTRVETVIPYWYNWMKTFPSVKALAEASPEDVNRLWAGLGYYRRAQLLRKGAEKILTEFQGQIPENFAELLEIPGIGPYTAGAISSIAFNKVEPLVDGNVIRVFSRLRAMQEQLGPKLEKKCWELAKLLVDPESPGNFNQALMELGATVCKPVSPSCHSCPVAEVCHALKLVELSQSQSQSQSLHSDTTESQMEDLPSSVQEFPRKAPKKRPRELVLSVGVICRNSTTRNDSDVEYLFVKRPDSGLLASQWEFPNVIMWEEKSVSGEANIPVFSEQELWSSLQKYLTSDLGVECTDENQPKRQHAGHGRGADKQAPICYLRCADHFRKGRKRLAGMDISENPIVHVFSHQRHTMHLTMRVVEECVGGSSDIAPNQWTSLCEQRLQARWMTAKDVTEAGLTSGVKKILQSLNQTVQPRKATGKTKKEVTGTKKGRQMLMTEYS